MTVRISEALMLDLPAAGQSCSETECRQSDGKGLPGGAVGAVREGGDGQ